MRFSMRSIASISTLIFIFISSFLLSGLFLRPTPTYAASAPNQNVSKGVLAPSTTVDSPDAPATVPRGVRRLHLGSGRSTSIQAADSQLAGDAGALLQNFNGTSSLDSEK